MSFFKGLIPGIILTFIVAGILGKNHSRGGFLDVSMMTVQGTSFHWSWPLFIAGTLLATFIFKTME
jgi:hypothetical protein